MSTSGTERFNELFCELEHSNEDEQRKKIGEMNEIVEGMDFDELESIFNEETFNKIYKMIEEKKMTMENVILLLKHAGYLKTLKNVWNPCFDSSSLNKRFEKMIFEEEKKKEKNEKLLVDLCGCYLLLGNQFNSELTLIYVPCLLKAASVKEENEEAQKEVEMALLTLSNINEYIEVKQELYLKEITEIIKHQQEQRNLTKLAYQCAWLFFINRFFHDYSLEDTITAELHFVGEAARELEELTRCIDWKNKEENEKRRKATKEEITLIRWVETCTYYFLSCRLWNEEYVELLSRIVQIIHAAGDNHREIGNLCISSLRYAAENRDVKVEDLLKGGAIDAILEEIQRQTLNEAIVNDCFQFLVNVSRKLKEKNKDEREEEERKALNRKVFEKMEEEGYEDVLTSFHETLKIFNRRYYHGLSLKFSDYLVNV
ncbi:uncharacterized protein MONOS_15021 [Monocercomonoides exilis]|uniref:uncharacterized protein n=1 Tax=Monocercomonoides exilis TaxID=2049356 RepID=UPI003559D674|nr:hypothetical protein MONOS_15021 [Monocercomonoides exilis]